MSFFKSLCLAIFATIFLTYALGTSLLEILDIHVSIDNHMVEPIKAISISALVMVILVLVAVAIVISVFGSIIFVVALVVGAGMMAILGTLWPLLLIALVIYAITKDKPVQQC